MVTLDFDKTGGLIPAIVQDYSSGDVLMLAFMNKEAWDVTIETGKATYFSRSRKKLWVKGETSGKTQTVREVRIDCDEDSVLLKVDQEGGAACHTGYRTCFHKIVESNTIRIDGAPVFDPETVYHK